MESFLFSRKIGKDKLKVLARLDHVVRSKSILFEHRTTYKSNDDNVHKKAFQVLALKGQSKRVKSPAAVGLPFHIRRYQAVSLPQHNKQIDEQFKISLG